MRRINCAADPKFVITRGKNLMKKIVSKTPD